MWCYAARPLVLLLGVSTSCGRKSQDGSHGNAVKTLPVINEHQLFWPCAEEKPTVQNFFRGTQNQKGYYPPLDRALPNFQISILWGNLQFCHPPIGCKWVGNGWPWMHHLLWFEDRSVNLFSCGSYWHTGCHTKRSWMALRYISMPKRSLIRYMIAIYKYLKVCNVQVGMGKT